MKNFGSCVSYPVFRSDRFSSDSIVMRSKFLQLVSGFDMTANEITGDRKWRRLVTGLAMVLPLLVNAIIHLILRNYGG